jgi:DNA-binding response OmpR family regulator
VSDSGGIKSLSVNEGAKIPRVLIVEDSELVRGALKLLLSETGHHVEVAGAIEEALALGELEPFDLMLLDLSLADGDGLTLLRELQERGNAPRVTVALTGRDDDDTRRRCLEAGCTDVLLKPVPARQLLALIAGWTSGAPDPV